MIQIEQGITIHFTAEFLDASGDFVNPPAPKLQISYKNKTGTTISDIVPLRLNPANPAIFACYWGSSLADPCVATVRVLDSGGSALASFSENFKIIQEYR